MRRRLGSLAVCHACRLWVRWVLTPWSCLHSSVPRLSEQPPAGPTPPAAWTASVRARWCWGPAARRRASWCPCSGNARCRNRRGLPRRVRAGCRSSARLKLTWCVRACGPPWTAGAEVLCGPVGAAAQQEDGLGGEPWGGGLGEVQQDSLGAAAAAGVLGGAPARRATGHGAGAEGWRRSRRMQGEAVQRPVAAS